MKQWYCMVKGQRYGPMDEAQLRQWIAEARVTGTDTVWCEGMEQWRPAAEVVELGVAAALPATQMGGPPMMGSALKPDRGTMILVLGILGLTLCGICGIPAWIMGKRDLAEIDAGLMDPRGRGTTQAGYICGMIASILLMIGGAFMVLYFIFIFIMIAANA